MIHIKSNKEITIMKEGGRVLASVLGELKNLAKPGFAMGDLDKKTEELIKNAGAAPSFKGYRPGGAGRPYPASACLSLNDEVVHGLANERILKEGDLLKIDVGVFFKGFHTDSAITVPVGKVSKQAHQLIGVTKQSLDLAINMVRPGLSLGDLGSAIEGFVGEHKFCVIRGLVGHGIGRKLQEEPMVPNFGKPGAGPKLKEGMVIAIEPMVSAGKEHIELAEDGFTYRMTDGSLAAHFEHTVAVRADGAEILTQL